MKTPKAALILRSPSGRPNKCEITLVENSLSGMPGTRSVSDFGLFSDFGILAYYNELDWGWEPNLNAKSVYVSCTAYGCIGFVRV
jgi:hypothetical protein